MRHLKFELEDFGESDQIDRFKEMEMDGEKKSH
jgi:hypothetical protein